MKSTLVIAGALIIGLSGCTPLGSGTLHSPSSTVTGAVAPTTEEAPDIYPTPMDFKIDVIVTKENCFGTAGCNITYEIDPNYVGTRPIKTMTKKRYRVLYEINGGDSPQSNSFVVTNGTSVHGDKSGTISTSGEEAPTLTATATRVIPEES
jgi:hypothetical protein